MPVSSVPPAETDLATPLTYKVSVLPSQRQPIQYQVFAAGSDVKSVIFQPVEVCARQPLELPSVASQVNMVFRRTIRSFMSTESFDAVACLTANTKA